MKTSKKGLKQFFVVYLVETGVIPGHHLNAHLRQIATQSARIDAIFSDHLIWSIFHHTFLHTFCEDAPGLFVGLDSQTGV